MRGKIRIFLLGIVLLPNPSEAMRLAAPGYTLPVVDEPSTVLSPTAISLAWQLPPTPVEAGVIANTVYMGVFNRLKGDAQPVGTHGLAALLPSAPGYVVTYSYDLYTWDEYDLFNLGLRYFDLFSISLTEGKPYWQKVLTDPIAEPQLEHLIAKVGNGIWFRSIIPEVQHFSASMVSVTITATSSQVNYLNVMLDTQTLLDADNQYPSWGTVTIHSVEPVLCSVPGVIPLPQGGDTRWSFNIYDNLSPNNSNNTIGYLGCAITSLAMLMNTVHQTPFTNPSMLNDWGRVYLNLVQTTLKAKGFHPNSANVDWCGFEQYDPSLKLRCTKTQNLTLTSTAIERAKADAVITQALCSTMPVILKVKSVISPNGDHFVLATGLTLVDNQVTYSIADPSGANRTSLLDPGNDGKMYGPHRGYRLYTIPTEPLPARMVIQLFRTPSPLPQGDVVAMSTSEDPPVELVVTDPEGLRVGENPDTGETYEEIPEAVYIKEAIASDNPTAPERLPIVTTVYLFKARNALYRIDAKGVGTGPYQVLVTTTAPDGTQAYRSFSGNAAPGTTQTYLWVPPYSPPKCLTPEALIATPVGDRLLATLRPGDRVWGEREGQRIPAVIARVMVHYAAEDIVQVGHIWLTPTHEVWDGRAWQPAAMLANQHRPYVGRLYDLTTDTGNFYAADGWLIHNKNQPPPEPMAPSSSGPSAMFRLGAVYSFPNPAKGVAPTIHLEVGLADSIEMTVYTQTGREVFHATIPGAHVLIVDGGYAYELPLETSNLGSGVYIAKLTAKKSGARDLTATVKLAVVK